jgi:hypothetical protein
MKRELLSSLLLIVFCALLFQSCSKDEKNNDPDPLPDLNTVACDAGLSLMETSAIKYAQAIDICTFSSGPTESGLVSAAFIRAGNTEIPVNNQYGIMQTFGTNNSSRKGQRLMAMSTGRARTPSQTNSCGSPSCSGTGVGSAPSGYPANVPGCPVNNNIYDDAGFEVTLRVPLTATGFSIDHNFFTFDFPEFVCTAYNDQFVILVDPAPPGSTNGNVAIDSVSNPIGVNSVLLAPTNTNLLIGTGFDIWGDAASTGWLRTIVPVTGGSTITIRFLIYDIGDDVSDSTVLIDNFLWLQGSVIRSTKKI